VKRFETKKIFIGDVPVGGDSPISVQSMTYSKTVDIEGTVEQINRLQLAGADIVRVAVPSVEDGEALREIRKRVSMPLVADIHFNYRLALQVADSVDAIRINPGNIGSKERVREVVKSCLDHKLPIRIGVNSGSLEKQFENRYGPTAQGMVASAEYNIKYLEDLGFSDIKVSMKASDVQRTVEAYRLLRPKNSYPFHLGVTEAGTKFHSTVKSSIGIGSLLIDGIGDTLRVSITGELEEEIRIGKAIIKDSGRAGEGVNIISCPTCGRLEADLVKAVDEVEKRTAHIKAPLNISVMGCAVNAIGEAKHADVAIAYGRGRGLIMVRGDVVAKLPEEQLVDRFISEVEEVAKEENR
jgi:(E)-4-hydroxy-3-methylbut-2-enyl-diphosphate synthase